MAWGAGNTLGATANKTANNNIGHVPTATAVVGSTLVAIVTKDNASTTDGNTNEITSMSDDAGGNTWNKLREFCNSQGSANAGATVAMFYSILATQLTASNTITANFSDTRTAKAISVWKFTIGAGNAIP